MKKGLLAAVVMVLSLVMISPALSGEKAEDNYRTYCWQCHGMNGNGNGINVRDMSVQPRDHTYGKEMASRSDDELFMAIKEGGPAVSKSVLMPHWDGIFSDEEIHDLVRYLRQRCQCEHGKY
ncbi:MAG TPA: cytochrome c [Gammaproteobacteria bacterium]|nr:cytochrome c [Gammaproteobacteria bacterium]